MNRRDIIETIILLSIVIIIKTFIVTPARVRGNSMDPTLKDKEFIVVNKINYILNKAKRFDIVVIVRNDDGDRLIKRVIGLPGETVEYKDEELYINGEKVETPIDFPHTNDFIYEELDDDEYFVMGDNRIPSIDSRKLGPIKSNEIKGTVRLVLFPFNRFGFVN